MSTKDDDEEIEKEIRSKKVDKENLSDYCIIHTVYRSCKISSTEYLQQVIAYFLKFMRLV
jgi:competence transcription factor ComK